MTISGAWQYNFNLDRYATYSKTSRCYLNCTEMLLTPDSITYSKTSRCYLNPVFQLFSKRHIPKLLSIFFKHLIKTLIIIHSKTSRFYLNYYMSSLVYKLIVLF